MKKFVLWILLSIIMPAFFMSNIVLGQEEADNDNSTKKETQQQWSTSKDIGIDFKWSCQTWMWKWCFDYEKLIWIDKTQNPNITATSIAQDVMRSATYMVWTVLTIIIIWCGLWYIFAARDGKDTSKYKKWLISAAIWALLVRWAYAIVRLIQYMAKW